MAQLIWQNISFFYDKVHIASAKINNNPTICLITESLKCLRFQQQIPNIKMYQTDA